MFVAMVALICLPTIIHRLGPEAFGLLALLWLVVGYFGVLDLGVAQSSIRFVSASMGHDDKIETATLVKNLLMLSLTLGIITAAGAVLLSFTDIFGLLSVPGSLESEARSSLRFLALCIPPLMIQGPLRSVLLSRNRFDIANTIAAVSGLLQWGGSALILVAGGKLLEVILLTVFIRYLTTALYCFGAVRYVPIFGSGRWTFNQGILRKVFAYTGWVSITQFLTSLVPVFERTLVASLLGLSFVTYFTVPADVVVKILIIPSSLAATLFPVLSGKWEDERGKSEGANLYRRSVKHTLLILIPISSVLVVFRHELLELWLGTMFADESAVVLGFLGAGILFNAVAQLPNAALFAVGRPDYVAKLQMIEIPLYVVCSIAATVRWGLAGTAAVWCMRVTVDSVVLQIGARKAIGSVHDHHAVLSSLRVAGLIAATVMLLEAVRILVPALPWMFLASALFLGVYALAVWKLMLDTQDRETISRLVLSVVPMRYREVR